MRKEKFRDLSQVLIQNAEAAGLKGDDLKGLLRASQTSVKPVPCAVLFGNQEVSDLLLGEKEEYELLCIESSSVAENLSSRDTFLNVLDAHSLVFQAADRRITETEAITFNFLVSIAKAGGESKPQILYLQKRSETLSIESDAELFEANIEVLKATLEDEDVTGFQYQENEDKEGLKQCQNLLWQRADQAKARYFDEQIAEFCTIAKGVQRRIQQRIDIIKGKSGDVKRYTTLRDALLDLDPTKVETAFQQAHQDLTIGNSKALEIEFAPSYPNGSNDETIGQIAMDGLSEAFGTTRKRADYEALFERNTIQIGHRASTFVMERCGAVDETHEAVLSAVLDDLNLDKLQDIGWTGATNVDFSPDPPRMEDEQQESASLNPDLPNLFVRVSRAGAMVIIYAGLGLTIGTLLREPILMGVLASIGGAYGLLVGIYQDKELLKAAYRRAWQESITRSLATIKSELKLTMEQYSMALSRDLKAKVHELRLGAIEFLREQVYEIQRRDQAISTLTQEQIEKELRGLTLASEKFDEALDELMKLKSPAPASDETSETEG